MKKSADILCDSHQGLVDNGHDVNAVQQYHALDKAIR